MIIFFLSDYPMLRELMGKLSTKNEGIQQCVLDWFNGLPAIKKCPIETQADLTQAESFEDAWGEYTRACRNQGLLAFSNFLDIFAVLGKENYDLLDLFARIAIAPHRIKVLAETLLLEELFSVSD